MKSVHTIANSHSADWLMSAFVNEITPGPFMRSTRSVHAAVLKNYDKEFTSGFNVFLFSSSTL